MLRKSGKPVVLCVNKCDRIGALPPELYEFYNLGLGDPIERRWPMSLLKRVDLPTLGRPTTAIRGFDIERTFLGGVMLRKMRSQAQLAIDSADVIILVTDISAGVTANDSDVAAMLRKQ